VPPQRHACVYHVDAIEEGSSRTWPQRAITSWTSSTR